MNLANWLAMQTEWPESDIRVGKVFASWEDYFKPTILPETA
jgi:hypothetical protein